MARVPRVTREKARRERLREHLRAALRELDAESAEERGREEEEDEAAATTTTSPLVIVSSSPPSPVPSDDDEPDTTDAIVDPDDILMDAPPPPSPVRTPPFAGVVLGKRARSPERSLTPPPPRPSPSPWRAAAVPVVSRVREEEEKKKKKQPPPPLLGPTNDPFPIVKNPFGLIMPRRWDEAAKRTLQQRFTPHTNKKNAHPRNARVRTVFTRSRHDYLLDGAKRSAANGWYSATGFMDFLFGAFDQDRQAERSSKGSNPKYAGKSPAEIKRLWDDNRDRASAIHRGCDKFLQHEPLAPDAPSAETDWEEGEPVLQPPPGFFRMMEALAPRYDVYATEFTLYSERWKALGQIDLLLVDRGTGEIILCDFKTYDDEDLESESDARDTGSHPFTARWLDSRLSHCRFQLNYYREILEQEYGVRVADTMFVFQFRPSDADGYYITRVPRYDMADFFALLPWQTDDPRHRTLADETLVPRVADDHPGCQGATTRIKVTKGPLPADVVWAGFPYANKGYELPDTIWKPHRRWRDDPPALLAAEYETKLLNNAELLRKLPTLYGKRIACWCWKHEHRCNCDVLVKYANLVGGGHLDVEKALR